MRRDWEIFRSRALSCCTIACFFPLGISVWHESKYTGNVIKSCGIAGEIRNICNSGYHARNLSTMTFFDSPDLCTHRI